MSENTESSPTFDLTTDPTPETTETDTVTDESDVKTETVDTDFFYPTKLDPARQLSPTGIYLDDVQRAEAEKARAKIEGREPDLKNPPATQGTPLWPRDHFNHSLNTLVIGDNEPDAVLPVVTVVP